MPYTANNLGRTSANYNGAAASEIFTYKSDTDTIADIRQSGYFNDAQAILKRGNYIFLQGTDAHELVKVTSAALPITVDTALTVGSTDIFTPGVERLIAVDTVYGPLYEIRDMDFGPLPNITTKDVVIAGAPAYTDLDVTKPVTISGYSTALLGGPNAQTNPLPLKIGPATVEINYVGATLVTSNLIRMTATFNAELLNGWVTIQYYKP